MDWAYNVKEDTPTFPPWAGELREPKSIPEICVEL